jgi:hypothetical protein
MEERFKEKFEGEYINEDRQSLGQLFVETAIGEDVLAFIHSELSRQEKELTNKCLGGECHCIGVAKYSMEQKEKELNERWEAREKRLREKIAERLPLIHECSEDCFEDCTDEDTSEAFYDGVNAALAAFDQAAALKD